MPSKKFITVIAASCALGLGAAGSVANAQESPSARATQTGTVLRFVDRVDPGSNVDLDLGAAGPSVGDQQLFVDRLMRNGKRIGTTTGVATITRLSNSGLRVQVVSTAKVPGGSLTLQFAFAEVFADGPAKVSTVAITGGTGTYAGATGQCRATLLSDGEDRSVVCRINLPG